MTDDEARKLVERLERGASPSIDVGSHLRKYQDLCNEAAAFIKATIATDEKPVAWRAFKTDEYFFFSPNSFSMAEEFTKNNSGIELEPLFLHPDPKVKEL